MKMLNTLSGILLAAALAVPAMAGPYEDGKAADYAGDARGGVRHYLKAAQQGNADAMYELGLSSRFGSGLPQDNKAAIGWFMAAAARGHKDAALFVGDAFFDGGWGVPKDREAAAYWYWPAGDDTGSVKAAYALGEALAKIGDAPGAVFCFSAAVERARRASTGAEYGTAAMKRLMQLGIAGYVTKVDEAHNVDNVPANKKMPPCNISKNDVARIYFGAFKFN